MTSSLTLDLLPDELVVMRLPPGSPVEIEPVEGAFLTAFVLTPQETTVVCPASAVPGIRSVAPEVEAGWRGLKVRGLLDFSLVGVLASLVVPLADAQISIFTISTFDTDYLLVKASRLDEALAALRKAGHSIIVADRP